MPLHIYNCGDISININSGWNLVDSRNENIDAEIALNPYFNRLIIAKDYLGAAYLPEWNFNGLNFRTWFWVSNKNIRSYNEFNLCEHINSPTSAEIYKYEAK